MSSWKHTTDISDVPETYGHYALTDRGGVNDSVIGAGASRNMRRDLAELIDRRKPTALLIEYLPDDDNHSAENWLEQHD